MKITKSTFLWQDSGGTWEGGHTNFSSSEGGPLQFPPTKGNSGSLVGFKRGTLQFHINNLTN